jgi:hypothetical protein
MNDDFLNPLSASAPSPVMDKDHPKPDLGSWGRILRVMGGLLSLTCSVEAPLPLTARVAVFGVSGVYLLLTAFSGTCYVSRLLARLRASGEARR